jgi:micrococcal nuclease
VVDGDTVEISPAIDGVEEVRLIGVDTPETVDPTEGIEPYGPQASAFAKRELTGRRVGLEFDRERVDQYGRLLAYVHAGGSMFNEELLKKGYAQAYPYPPNTAHAAQFAAAQRKARAAGLGIWGSARQRNASLRTGATASARALWDARRVRVRSREAVPLPARAVRRRPLRAISTARTSPPRRRPRRSTRPIRVIPTTSTGPPRTGRPARACLRDRKYSRGSP